MSYNSQNPNKLAEETSRQGTLRVEVPHWAAQVRLYDNRQRPVEEASAPREASDSPGLYVSEMKLAPGIYKVEATLEGRTEIKEVSIYPGKTRTIERDKWKSLKLTSAAPLSDTVTAQLDHTNIAIEWSKKPTWKNAPGGPSRLFLFARTLKPKRYTSFTEGLRLLKADGSTLTDFSEGTESDMKAGWMAFNAALPEGFYILKRDRKEGPPRHLPVYLCPGWDTQIFLIGRSQISLRTGTLSMALPGKGFVPDDEEMIAAEAVFESLQDEASATEIVTSDKLNTLLRKKFENPWLGILGAYALLRSKERNQSGQPERADDEIASLLAMVLSNLSMIQGHPDLRALRLRDDEPASAPFPHPPLLQIGLKRVQAHSVKYAATIPYRSLTDCMLNTVLVDSVWTSWRTLSRVPFGWQDSQTVMADAKVRPRSRKLALSARLSSYGIRITATATSKNPVFRLPDAAEARQAAEEITGVPGLPDAWVNASLIQKVLEVMRQSGLSDLPSTVTLNVKQSLSQLLENVTPEEVSRTFNLPLSRVTHWLKALRVGQYPLDDEAVSGLQSSELITPTQQAVFQYSLGKAESARAAGVSGQAAVTESLAPGAAPLDPAADAPAPPVTIEECVNRLRSEAACLRLKAKGMPTSPDLSGRALGIAAHLERLADELLKYAEFIVVTGEQGKILYCNGAFLALLAPAPAAPTDPSFVEVKKVRQASKQVWRSALAAAASGRTTMPDPGSGALIHNWDLRRTAIVDDQSGAVHAYLNILRGRDVPRFASRVLPEIEALLPKLTLNISLLGRGSSEQRDNYTQRLERLVDELEQIVSKADGGPIQQQPTPGAETTQRKEQTMNADDPGDNKPLAENDLDEDVKQTQPGGTLYESEFWSISRHELIAGTADERLGPQARTQVDRILAKLGSGLGLADIAGWADTVKRRKAQDDDDQETKDFLANEDNRKTNDTWHYVNLPLGATGYDPEEYKYFTRDNDVVHIINECVRALKGYSQSPDFEGRFSEVNALRLLTHLVGDVHQPVHVGCCYIDESGPVAKLETEPAKITAEELGHDQGGNKIILPIGQNGASLHSYWDSRLGGSNPDLGDPADAEAVVADEAGPELKKAFIRKLIRLIKEEEKNAPAEAAEADVAAVEQWAADWATDSLGAARDAYQSLEITGPNANDAKKFDVSWEGREAYDARCKPIAIGRLKAAARNLAAMLDAIWS